MRKKSEHVAYFILWLMMCWWSVTEALKHRPSCAQGNISGIYSAVGGQHYVPMQQHSHIHKHTHIHAQARTHTHPHRRKMGTYDISTTFEDTAFQRDYRKNKWWSVLFESHTSLWGQVLFWSLGDTNRTQSQTHTHKSESADILGLTIYDCKILG